MILIATFSLLFVLTNAQFGESPSLGGGGYRGESDRYGPVNGMQSGIGAGVGVGVGYGAGVGTGIGQIGAIGPIGSAGEESQELNYEAQGRLVCGMDGAEKVRVVMWDRYRERDNIIYDEVLTDPLGNFRVRATKNSFDSRGIAPFLTIYHDCDDEETPGLRKMTVQLPSRYTNQGQLAIKTFDIGTWNLETSFAGEEIELSGRNHHHQHHHRGAGSRPLGGYEGASRGRFGNDRRGYNQGRRDDRDYDGPIQV